ARDRDLHRRSERPGHLVVDEGTCPRDGAVVRAGRAGGPGRGEGRHEQGRPGDTDGSLHETRMFEMASKNFETSTMSLPWKTMTFPAGRSTPGSIATTSAVTVELNRIRRRTGWAIRYGLISERRSTPRRTPSRIRFCAS